MISADDAMRLVGVRGRAMAKAAAAEATGMTAVLGGAQDEVLAALEAHGLTPANVNGAGQIVAAGTMAQLAALAADPPAGARLRPLLGGGRVPHRAHGARGRRAAGGRGGRRGAATRRSCCSPTPTGPPSPPASDWLDRIVIQVSAPVRWDECMRSMAGLGVSALIELPPGGTLTGLARRALPGLALAALKTPDHLGHRALAAGRAREHRSRRSPATCPSGGCSFPRWPARSGPAPDDGDAAPGCHVRPGATLGHVEVRSGQHPVTPAFSATILEWLVEDGDPVTEGQPLVRLQPEPA